MGIKINTRLAVSPKSELKQGIGLFCPASSFPQEADDNHG